MGAELGAVPVDCSGSHMNPDELVGEVAADVPYSHSEIAPCWPLRWCFGGLRMQIPSRGAVVMSPRK